MSNRKCGQCGLVNFAEKVECRRCSATLSDPVPDQPGQEEPLGSFSVRLLPLAGTIAALLFVWWASLLLTSDGLNANQRAIVEQAVALLRERGFAKEASVLGRLTSFRSTDNWWNRYVGHGQAYAATNFPFEVVTLYPPFFERSADDTERAIILLHESYHLLGADEGAALAGVWRVKSRLGWTAATHSQTRVWRNTREWTKASSPALFACGIDGESDCLE
jgi:hypothetical protein